MSKKNTDDRNNKEVENISKNEDTDINEPVFDEVDEINDPQPQEFADQQEPELQTDAAAVNELLITLEEERDQFKDALIHERADFENYKKRNADLAASSYNNGIINTVAEILPVLDNFERALTSECVDKAFLEGMQMIMRQLQGVLDALGVEKICTDGQFDPQIHNAVMQVEDEDFGSNEIVETLQNGYRLRDKILRHASVKVNK